MPIKVDWTDRNITVDAFRLYRSDTPIPDTPLPAPLVQVSGTTFTYTDNTVVRNKTYYYRVGVVVGTEETLSSNVALAFMPYTGPGPQKLLRGDWASGFFGKLTIDEMFNQTDILLQMASGFASSGGMSGWNKHVYQGKILFYPDSALTAGMTWQQIYTKGLMYGNTPQADWPAWVKTTYGIVPQGVIVQRGEHQFVCRTPMIRSSIASTDTTSPAMKNGEYDNCLATPYQGRTLGTPGSGFPGTMDDQTHGRALYSMCADLVGPGTIYTKTNPVDAQTSLGTTSSNSSYGWRPVLELV